jgi:hypothetical protein
METTRVTAERVMAVIRGYRYRHINEAEWQRALADALLAQGVPARREVPLGDSDRIDILAGRVGVEVKVAGSPEEVERQLRRYAASDRVDELILVTSRTRHGAIPRRLGGKPVTVLIITGAFS